MKPFKASVRSLKGRIVNLERAVADLRRTPKTCDACGGTFTETEPGRSRYRGKEHLGSTHFRCEAEASTSAQLARKWKPLLDKHMAGSASVHLQGAAKALEDLSRFWEGIAAAAKQDLSNAREKFVEAREKFVEARGHFAEAREGMDRDRDREFLVDLSEEWAACTTDEERRAVMDKAALKERQQDREVLASVCAAGMCDHRKFGSECPALTPEEIEKEKETEAFCKEWDACTSDEERQALADKRVLKERLALAERDNAEAEIFIDHQLGRHQEAEPKCLHHECVERVQKEAEDQHDRWTNYLHSKASDIVEKLGKGASSQEICEKVSEMVREEESKRDQIMQDDLSFLRNELEGERNELENAKADLETQVELADGLESELRHTKRLLANRDDDLDRLAAWLIREEIEIGIDDKSAVDTAIRLLDSIQAELKARQRDWCAAGDELLEKAAMIVGDAPFGAADRDLQQRVVRNIRAFKSGEGGPGILSPEEAAVIDAPQPKWSGQHGSRQWERDVLLHHCAKIVESAYGKGKASEAILALGSDSVMATYPEGASLSWDEVKWVKTLEEAAKIVDRVEEDSAPALAEAAKAIRELACGARHPCTVPQPPGGRVSVEQELKSLRQAHADQEERIVKARAAQHRAEFELAKLKNSPRAERLYDTERSPGVGQTAHQARIEKMMAGYGQNVPSEPALPDEATRVLRARLIMEETLETIQKGLRVAIKHKFTMGPGGGLPIGSFDDLGFRAMPGPANLVEIADGCADISVVTIGTLSACGIADKDLLEVVDMNNLDKVNTGREDEHGKWIKHPDHQPPDIAAVLRDQGWGYQGQAGIQGPSERTTLTDKIP